jgi:hypothetical protein
MFDLNLYEKVKEELTKIYDKYIDDLNLSYDAVYSSVYVQYNRNTCGYASENSIRSGIQKQYYEYPLIYRDFQQKVIKDKLQKLLSKHIDKCIKKEAIISKFTKEEYRIILVRNSNIEEKFEIFADYTKESLFSKKNIFYSVLKDCENKYLEELYNNSGFTFELDNIEISFRNGEFSIDDYRDFIKDEEVLNKAKEIWFNSNGERKYNDCLIELLYLCSKEDFNASEYVDNFNFDIDDYKNDYLDEMNELIKEYESVKNNELSTGHVKF